MLVLLIVAAFPAFAAEVPLQPDSPAEIADLPPEAGGSGSEKSAVDPPPRTKTAAEEIAEKAEAQAQQDPLAVRQVTKQIEKERSEAGEATAVVPKKAFHAKLYGSARLLRRLEDNDTVWSDGGSRIGLQGGWSFDKENSIIGSAEYGFNLLNSLDRLYNWSGFASERGDATSLFPRVVYVGLETANNLLIYGKNWSAYYQVAEWTDRLQGTGGGGLGVYNAETDGGPTGTGRADGVLQTRLAIGFLPKRWFKPFKMNFQAQYGEPVPQTESLHYGTAVGASAIAQMRNDFFIGWAVNYAEVKDLESPEARAVNLQGNAQAYLLGLRKFTDDWYVGLGVARLLNHMTTNQGIYFLGWGGEFYAHKRVAEKIWLSAGANFVQPDSDQYAAGAYEVAYGVVGLRYSFRTFSRMLYLNYRFDHGRQQNGDEIPDAFTIGIRWDLP